MCSVAGPDPAALALATPLQNSTDCANTARTSEAD